MDGLFFLENGGRNERGIGGWEKIEQSVPSWILRLKVDKANVTNGLSSLHHFGLWISGHIETIVERCSWFPLQIVY